MREPAFWWKPGTGLLLSPLGAAYGMAASLRLRARGCDAGAPVICLGNLTVGGGGKTPAAMAVARVLHGAPARAFFLTRGYGGRLAGPVSLNPSVHSAIDVGDEPLLLARIAPTIVARDRVAGAKAALLAGARVIIMDDGFQNPSLRKDLAILAVDGSRGVGNGRVIPAGPLRAPLSAQLARAHAIIVIGPVQGASAIVDSARRRGLTLFHARLEPDRQVLAALGGRKVLAFAGIANPEKFFATLTEAGVTIAERQGFDDHHRYTAAEARSLMDRAQAQRLVLLTTEKDHVRLAGDPAIAELARRAATLPVRLVIEEESAFSEMIIKAAKPL